jgi:hypothetical protein
VLQQKKEGEYKMIKAKYIGKESYKADEFHASSGNSVSMSDEQWAKIGKDQKLFKVIKEDKKEFPNQITRLPGWKEEEKS